jgi:hypothetical protein
MKHNQISKLLPYLIALIPICLVVFWVYKMCIMYIAPVLVEQGVIDAPKQSYRLDKACNYSMTSCIEKPILFIGSITKSSVYDLIKQVESTDDTICFQSNGGDNDGASLIAHYIYLNKLSTCVADVYIENSKTYEYGASCASACVYTLASGLKRLNLSDDPQIIIHRGGGEIIGFKLNGLDALNTDRYVSMFEHFGPNHMKHIELVNFAKSIDFKDHLILSATQLEYYRIFTKH